MALRLYELAGLGDRRYSLYSWRARLALAHMSSFEVLDAADVVAAWRERLLDLHGSLARSAPARAETAGAT